MNTALIMFRIDWQSLRKMGEAQSGPASWEGVEGVVVLGAGAEFRSVETAGSFLFGYHMDEEFPSVETGQKIVSILYSNEPRQSFLQFATDIFCNSIAAFREGDWFGLARAISDWTATAEVASDKELRRRLLRGRQRPNAISTLSPKTRRLQAPQRKPEGQERAKKRRR